MRVAWLTVAVALFVGCTSAPQGAQFEETQVTAPDGLSLAARRYGSGDTAIVLGHMGGPTSSLTDWSPLSEHLAREGFTVLAYNRAGACNPDGSQCSDRRGGMQRGAEDMLAAVEHVRRDGATRVFVGGASLGAMAALAAAELDPTVEGVFFFAGGLRAGGYDFDEESIAQLDVPLLLAAGTGDGAAAQTLETLDEWSNAANTLVLVQSELHGTDLLEAGGDPARQVIDAVTAFMAD